MTQPRPALKSPGYDTTPHEWGLEAGVSRRGSVARTFHVRAVGANLVAFG